MIQNISASILVQIVMLLNMDIPLQLIRRIYYQYTISSLVKVVKIAWLLDLPRLTVILISLCHTCAALLLLPISSDRTYFTYLELLYVGIQRQRIRVGNGSNRHAATNQDHLLIFTLFYQFLWIYSTLMIYAYSFIFDWFRVGRFAGFPRVQGGQIPFISLNIFDFKLTKIVSIWVVFSYFLQGCYFLFHKLFEFLHILIYFWKKEFLLVYPCWLYCVEFGLLVLADLERSVNGSQLILIVSVLGVRSMYQFFSLVMFVVFGIILKNGIVEIGREIGYFDCNQFALSRGKDLSIVYHKQSSIILLYLYNQIMVKLLY